MTYLDLFSGIGGFALGAYWAGMRFSEHYFSEIDPYCVELYQRRFPDAIALGDIKEIDCAELADTASSRLERGEKAKPGREGSERGPMGNGPITSNQDWLITGGFPCQDISVAGKGAGIRGERSGLWFEMWRVIRELRPRYVIAENVGALTHRGLDTVLSSLAEIGYDAEWQDIRAEDVGAPHRRERIWIVAYPTGSEARPRSGETRARESDEAHGPRVGGELPYPNRGRLEERSELHSDQTQPGLETSRRDDVGGRLEEMADESAQERRRILAVGERAQSAATDGREMADSSRERIDRSGESGPRRWTESTDGSEGPITRRSECGDREGGWTAEPDVGRLAHGVSRRVDRLRGLGNAIVPQIAAALFSLIK